MTELENAENNELELSSIEEDTQEGKYLTFPLRNEEYGIEIRNVTEIIGIQSITSLPDMPFFVKGVINLRGKVIPVIDVRSRFGFDPRAYDERTCIIVVNIDGRVVGLIVDSVNEVIDIAPNNIEPPPRVKKGEPSRFIKALGKVGDKVKILLDINQMLVKFDPELIQKAVE